MPLQHPCSSSFEYKRIHDPFSFSCWTPIALLSHEQIIHYSPTEAAYPQHNFISALDMGVLVRLVDYQNSTSELFQTLIKPSFMSTYAGPTQLYKGGLRGLTLVEQEEILLPLSPVIYDQ